jgi:hypothetical protein
MSDGLRLLISSNPLWQQGGMDHPLPAHVTNVYMVMGKSGNLWQTVLSSTEDLHVAKQTLHKADRSGKYERLVISEGRSVNKAPASRWTTIETVIHVPSRFEVMMHAIRDKAANGNPPQLPEGAYQVGHKQSQNFLLGLACLLAFCNYSPLALLLVCVLAICDIFFMMNSHPLTLAQAKSFNDKRNWAFATLNGVLLLTLLLS